MIIRESEYKGIKVIELDSGKYCAKIIPQQGSKLCSLTDNSNGKEFIFQGKSTQYRMASYESGYLDGECAGVDEAFPNIDEYFYDRKPWKGVLLPDHGEVWSQPWSCKVESDEVILKIDGVRLPYILEKRVKWKDESRLHMEYTLTNNSDFEMDYIWASHMMLEAEKGSRFKFPDGLSESYTTMSDSRTIGGYGDTFCYPCGTSRDGRKFDMSVYRGNEADDYQKWYFADKVPGPVGWAEIIHPDSKVFRIEFPSEEIPYLGAIQAEGGELDIRCMFLEPCSGAWDRSDIARMHQMNSTIKPRETKKWYLDIIIG